jgi:glycosyltransferase involved in cell wall biosynthesis
VFLGVRQDLPTYVRARHPGRIGFRAAAAALEFAYRALARLCPTIVVGPALAGNYARAGRLLELTVSLVSREDVVDSEDALTRTDTAPLTVLSVGRLEAEKNPLLLADVLAALRSDGRDWRLVVCGEGPLHGALAERLSELGQAEHSELRGYVPFGDQMRALYRESAFFLHVSLTEGMPQVLLEALAAGLPVVATDVGGVRAAVGGLVSLVPPRDPAAAVAAMRRLDDDDTLRAGRIVAGLRHASAHTIEAEVATLARFIDPGGARPSGEAAGRPGG